MSELLVTDRYIVLTLLRPGAMVIASGRKGRLIEVMTRTTLGESTDAFLVVHARGQRKWHRSVTLDNGATPSDPHPRRTA